MVFQFENESSSQQMDFGWMRYDAVCIIYISLLFLFYDCIFISLLSLVELKLKSLKKFLCDW
eukprot:m.332859 g.332859  ORF g.332859 m.332859 type:complete len:62 (-) comp17016_c0_seq1:908-1093(-)